MTPPHSPPPLKSPPKSPLNSHLNSHLSLAHPRPVGSIGIMILGMTVALLFTTSLTGCSSSVFSWFSDGGGNIQTTSHMNSGVQIDSGFTQGVYRLDDSNHLTLVLMDGDGDLAHATQAAILRMHWKPRAGRTPLDENASNATIQYLILSGTQHQEVGIYSGAGYFFPVDTPGDEFLAGNLLQATVLMTDRSANFVDLLGQANMQGSLSARLDHDATERLVRQLTKLASEKLAYPRLVAR